MSYYCGTQSGGNGLNRRCNRCCPTAAYYRRQYSLNENGRQILRVPPSGFERENNFTVQRNVLT